MDRVMLAGLVGQALAHTGRKPEAVQLFRAADEAGRMMLRNGNVTKQVLAEIAINQAILGRKEQAIALLNQAVAKGWLGYEGMGIRLAEMPWFAALHRDAGFARIVRTVEARRERERRETAALALI